MRSTTSKALFLFLSVFFSLQVFAANLYCDYTNGNDANNCTNGTTQLCKTLQRCVNVATRGDVIKIANTSAQVLAANFSTSGGYNNSGSGYLTFEAWDNGGSLTIQRPDEASARIGAVIDGANTYVFQLGIQSVVLKNIRFQNFADKISALDNSIASGCEFTAISNNGGEGVNFYIGSLLENNYFHDMTSVTGLTSYFYPKIINNYFEDNMPSIAYNLPTILIAGDGGLVKGNIFVNNGHKYTIEISSGVQSIISNTIISDGTAAKNGLQAAGGLVTAYNNLFYNFDGAGSLPINITTALVPFIGHNAFYDSNASTIPSLIGVDLTANDVSTTGDPFVDYTTGDLSLDPTTGTAAIGAGLANPNSSIDIGVVQSAAGGGGGSSEHSYTWVN